MLFSITALVVLASCGNPKPEGPAVGTPQEDALVGAEDFPALNEQIKASPNNPELYIKRAHLLLAEGEAEQAMGDIDRALSLIHI